MSIWLEGLQKDDFLMCFLSHLVNDHSWLERDVFSFVIAPKLSQKHSLDYKDPVGYPTGSMLIRRRQKQYKIKVWYISKSNVHLVGETWKRRFCAFSLLLEYIVFLALKWNKFILYYSKTFSKTFFK